MGEILFLTIVWLSGFVLGYGYYDYERQRLGK
jgi:hypothetical protein